MGRLMTNMAVHAHGRSSPPHGRGGILVLTLCSRASLHTTIKQDEWQHNLASDLMVVIPDDSSVGHPVAFLQRQQLGVSLAPLRLRLACAIHGHGQIDPTRQRARGSITT
jgi:hypothetical protein